MNPSNWPFPTGHAPDFQSNLIGVNMKVKTAELTGSALNWAVAKCEGENASIYGGVVRVMFRRFGPELNYSTDWAQAGPIIAREGLCVQPYCGLYEYNPIIEWESFVMARCFENEHPHGVGPTPLIAAMRCYVDSKLGDEIEVPNELVNP
jgi:hypothetical protein